MNIPLALFLMLCLLLARPVRSQGMPEVEPNDTLLQATPLAGGMQGFGEVAPAGDVDGFALTILSFADLFAWTAPGFASPVQDTRLALLDATGQPLASNDDGGAGFGWYSSVQAWRVPPGTYYLLVEGFDPTTVGSYTLDVQVLEVTPLASGFEGPEVNDSRLLGGVATGIAIDSRMAGVLSAPGGGTGSYTHPTADYDFYAFTVTTAGDYTIATQSTALLPAQPPRCTDTVLYVVNANNLTQVLASNDDADGSLWSSMRLSMTPGSYCAVVTAFGLSVGSYAIDITGPEAVLPTAGASFTNRPGGCLGTFGLPMLGVRSTSIGGIDEPERPLLGTTFYLDLTGLPPSALVLRCTGLLPLSQPLDLGAIGAPGCQFEVDVFANQLAIADPQGVDFWPTTLLSYTWLLGLPIEQQAAALDPGANVLGVSLSNRVSWRIGRRH